MKPVKPSVPKVVITADKPKVPAPVVKTTERVAIKQEAQAHFIQEKVNRTIVNVMVILISHSHTDMLIILQ